MAICRDLTGLQFYIFSPILENTFFLQSPGKGYGGLFIEDEFIQI